MITECLEYIAENAKIQIRVTPEAWEAIQESGKIKNQFETRHCFSRHTAADLKGRKIVENKLFGIPFEAEAEERPIYGYLAYGEGCEAVNAYGNIILVLKDEVKERSTFMYSDSFTYEESMDIDGMKASSFSDITEHCTHEAFWDDVCSRWDDIDGMQEYFEVQIYGGIDISDIEDVIYL